MPRSVNSPNTKPYRTVTAEKPIRNTSTPQIVYDNSKQSSFSPGHARSPPSFITHPSPTSFLLWNHLDLRPELRSSPLNPGDLDRFRPVTRIRKQGFDLYPCHRQDLVFLWLLRDLWHRTRGAKLCRCAFLTPAGKEVPGNSPHTHTTFVSKKTILILNFERAAKRRYHACIIG
ncbi:hypothetical protein FPSE5266_20041 [Fusarium pseudograminearum]|nr:hypothetical protein FPSE5266_20041 [Fusarium pseudograminearum]